MSLLRQLRERLAQSDVAYVVLVVISLLAALTFTVWFLGRGPGGGVE